MVAALPLNPERSHAPPLPTNGIDYVLNSIDPNMLKGLRYRYFVKRTGHKLRNLFTPEKPEHKRYLKKVVLPALRTVLQGSHSNYSFGGIPKRSTHYATLQAREYLNQGLVHLVKIDFKDAFFNTPKGFLVKVLHPRAYNSPLGWAIYNCLTASYFEEGNHEGENLPTNRGLYQGCPLSMELFNLYVGRLDHFLEGYQVRFCRFVDDILFFCSCEDDAKQLYRWCLEELPKGLYLPINREKSSLYRPETVVFVGYSFYYDGGNYKIRIPHSSINKHLEDVKTYLYCWLEGVDKRSSFNDLKNSLNGWVSHYKNTDDSMQQAAIDDHIQNLILGELFRILKSRKERVTALCQLFSSKHHANRMTRREALNDVKKRREAFNQSKLFSLQSLLVKPHKAQQEVPSPLML